MKLIMLILGLSHLTHIYTHTPCAAILPSGLLALCYYASFVKTGVFKDNIIVNKI